MKNLHDTPALKGGRVKSVQKEQSLCRRAMESGKYDLLSDDAWVALCEKVATNERESKGQSADTSGKNS